VSNIPSSSFPRRITDVIYVVTGSALLPTFHMMGLFLQIINPLMSGATASILRPNYPDAPLLPTPQLVLDGMKKTKCNIACAVPAYLEVHSSDTYSRSFFLIFLFLFIDVVS
jgi:acyl-coenzyme A synthetase/AMP-(fatty) acid ligase